jgi:hypothetical protein
MPGHALTPAAKPSLRPALIAAAILLTAGTYSAAMALEQTSVTNGLTACVNWCIRNNKSPANVESCQRACQSYWYCNGSDAAKWKGHCIDARRYRAAKAAAVDSSAASAGNGDAQGAVAGSMPVGCISAQRVMHHRPSRPPSGECGLKADGWLCPPLGRSRSLFPSAFV